VFYGCYNLCLFRILIILYISYFYLNRILNIKDLYLFKILNILRFLYISNFYLNKTLNNLEFVFIYFFYKVFVLGITMQLDISAKLTPQVTTIICHHMKKNIITKRKKKENTKIWGD